MALLGLDVGGEQPAQLRLPGGAPRKSLPQHGCERRLPVHRARIDGEAGRFGGKAAFRLRQAELVAREIHQVARVGAVVDGERGVKADPFGELAQQAGADRMEGARPGERGGGQRRAARRGGDDALDPALHLGRGAAREGHQQEPTRIGPVDDEMGDPMGERVGLARAGAGDDEERPVVGRGRADAVLDGAPLLRIELGQVGGHRRGESPAGRRRQRTTFPVLFATAAAFEPNRRLPRPTGGTGEGGAWPIAAHLEDSDGHSAP